MELVQSPARHSVHLVHGISFIERGKDVTKLLNTVLRKSPCLTFFKKSLQSSMADRVNIHPYTVR